MNDERLARLLNGLAPVESKPRKREYLYAVIAVLLVAHLEASDRNADVVNERMSQAVPALAHPASIFDHELVPCDATMRVSVGWDVELIECYRRSK